MVLPRRLRSRLPAERLHRLARTGACAGFLAFDLTPPADLSEYALRFARHFRISRRMFDRMKRRLADDYGIAWDRLRIDAPLAHAPARLLIFHDAADPKVPFRDGQAIARAWPGARLVSTRRLGHHRILRDPRVVRRATAFVTGWRAAEDCLRLPASAAS